MGQYNPTGQQGATFTRLITLTDNAGAAVNITGYTARMMLKRDYNSPIAVLSLTSSNGLTITGAAGTVLITMTAA